MVGQVANAIYEGHSMVSAFLGAPELAISEADASAISDKALNVACWFAPINKGQSLYFDIAVLGGVLAMVYWPRLKQFKMRVAKEQASRSHTQSVGA